MSILQMGWRRSLCVTKYCLLIVCHKVLLTYREGDMVYIEYKNPLPAMVDKGLDGDIRVKGVVTNGVANVLWSIILRRVQTKKVQNTVVHTSLPIIEGHISTQTRSIIVPPNDCYSTAFGSYNHIFKN